jgi:hypothetical protein
MTKLYGPPRLTLSRYKQIARQSQKTVDVPFYSH